MVDRRTKKQLLEELAKSKAMFAASLTQLDTAQYIELELESYKGYLKDTNERLTKVRKERDLAIQLLHIRTA